MTATNSIADTVPTKLWLGGRQVHAQSGATFPVYNPSSGQVVVHVADATAEDGLMALALAHQVQADWAGTPARARAEILRRAFDLVQQRAEDFAQIITLPSRRTMRASLRPQHTELTASSSTSKMACRSPANEPPGNAPETGWREKRAGAELMMPPPRTSTTT